MSNALPEGILILDYSEDQRCFHFDNNPDSYREPCWKALKAMSREDAVQFTQFMEKKYVDSRKSGRLPELSVVKLELELFFALKSNRRKLAGR